MNKIMKWTPRVLTILFICFISLFALDVFGAGYKWYEVIIAFFMHMIPSLVLLGLLIWAWHKPRWGGSAFILLSIVFTVWFKTYNNIFSLLTISGIPLLIGVLFVSNK